MNELLQEKVEHKLRYEGPNYTADAVVIDPDASKILLIKRGDTGAWALPGGFVDRAEESSRDAAVREAKEEANVELTGDAPLIFRGIVDDPRNSDTAWIETSAHLFTVAFSNDVLSGDDATAVAWCNLSDLPTLYASHRAIVERGLDYIDGKQLVDTALHAKELTPVSGGYMKYGKYVADDSVFVKQCDPEKDAVLFTYLEKEAYSMAHLRQHGFTNIPRQSVLYKDSLMMSALRPEDGWRWQAEQETLHAYIDSAFEAFSRLESMPLPADLFTIEPSRISFANEGWLAFDDSTAEELARRAGDFLPRLSPEQQTTARQMLLDVAQLQELAAEPRESNELVFCHHDVRQDNLAWHSEHGSALVDWSWAGAGEPGSDATSLLIDLHKNGYDVSTHIEAINPGHCLTLIGFWLAHSTWPYRKDDTLRFEQFGSAVSAYALLGACGSGV